MPPVSNLTEEVTELAEGEEEAVAEISCQGGQIRDGDHLGNAEIRSGGGQWRQWRGGCRGKEIRGGEI